MSELDNLRKTEEALTEVGVEYKIITHGPITTVEEGLRILGIPAADGVSTLIFKSDGKFFSVIRRDDHHLDLPKVKKLLGVRKLVLAAPEEVLKVTGATIGAVPLVNKDLEPLVDRTVLEREYVYGGTGSPRHSLKIKPHDLVSVTGAIPAGVIKEVSGKRILTGDRPTGKLHLGHYVGSLKNRVRLQDEYECFFIVADLHTLTTAVEKEKITELPENIREMVLDYLSVGIDPQKSTIYLQSQVPEVTYLSLLFSMLVTVPRCQRVPTLKEVMRDLKITQPSLGLLTYPVLQAADILMVLADLVPVGKDQESHVEVTREIARKFNSLYGEVFPEPKPLIGEVPTLVGTDGRAKMSKSLGNCIYLSEPPEAVKEKVMEMYTDPTRIHPTDPGHTEGNPVFIYHEAFNSDKEEVEDLKKRYREGKVGDIEVKEKLVKVLNEFLEPIRQKRKEFAAQPGLVDDIIMKGSERARKEAAETLKLVKEAMGLEYFR